MDAILAGAPEVDVVVTSREPLGLEGEQVGRVQSLALPEADDPLPLPLQPRRPDCSISGPGQP